MIIGGRYLVWLLPFLAVAVSAQIDPVKRDLIQFGYNQPLEGRAPVAGYAYYYRNDPDFLRTNLTLRLALAPTYLDSELGFAQGLGPQTDFALGIAGGGFADSYNKMRGGRWVESESFDGHGGEVSASAYHLFNPGAMIPLNFVLRGAVHESFFAVNDGTAANFQLPHDTPSANIRTGLRYGGMEPTLFPELAMELAVWYEGEFRLKSGSYGFGGDREVSSSVHLFWASAALAYKFPESKQRVSARLVCGTSLQTDPLTAYRLGGYLPLAAEYPLSLPGYYFQEFSARQFALINASYMVPIAPNDRWNLRFNAATAGMDYYDGTDQAGNWVSGVGAGILYCSPSNRFKCAVGYGYGIDAIRSGQRGANSLNFLLQFDLEKPRDSGFQNAEPGQWRGWNWLLGR